MSSSRPKPIRLVNGIGINDADYEVQIKIEGKKSESGRRTRVIVWECPYYRRWVGILSRISTNHFYSEITICDEWKTFSNFRKWMESKDWQGMDLDKDLKILGSKVYSPETCSFIPHRINSLLIGFNGRTGLPGASYTKRIPELKKPWRSTVYDGNGKSIHLGYFKTEKEAHIAWRFEKSKIITEAMNEWLTEYSLCENILSNLRRIAEGLKIPNVITVANPYLEF